MLVFLVFLTIFVLICTLVISYYFTVNLWKSHRKLLLPVFQTKVVEEYLEVISEQVHVLLQRLDEQTDKEQFDILKYVTACTLDIVFRKFLQFFYIKGIINCPIQDFVM